MKPEVIMYTKDTCPYCVAAKNLLTQKGAQFKEINIEHDEKARAEMLEKAAPRRTVPQIFIGGQSVGGFDDIKKLEVEGKLDALLKG